IIRMVISSSCCALLPVAFLISLSLFSFLLPFTTLFRSSDRPDIGAVDAPAARSRIASLTRARSARSPCAPVRGQSSRACFSSERPFHDPPLPPCLRRHLLCSAPRPAHRLLLERG